MTKTVREWLETIEDETIRKSALRQMRAEASDIEEDSLACAIIKAFNWDESVEGYIFWWSIYFKYESQARYEE